MRNNFGINVTAIEKIKHFMNKTLSCKSCEFSKYNTRKTIICVTSYNPQIYFDKMLYWCPQLTHPVS